jgi:hypothetical protein
VIGIGRCEPLPPAGGACVRLPAIEGKATFDASSFSGTATRPLKASTYAIRFLRRRQLSLDAACEAWLGAMSGEAAAMIEVLGKLHDVAEQPRRYVEDAARPRQQHAPSTSNGPAKLSLLERLTD